MQQRIELGDQVLDLACGNPLGEGLEYRVGDLACRRLVDVQPLPDPAPELVGRHDVQVSVLRLGDERLEGVREATS